MPVRGMGVRHLRLKVVVLFAIDLLYVLDKRAFLGTKHTPAFSPSHSVLHVHTNKCNAHAE